MKRSRFQNVSQKLKVVCQKVKVSQWNASRKLKISEKKPSSKRQSKTQSGLPKKVKVSQCNACRKLKISEATPSSKRQSKKTQNGLPKKLRCHIGMLLEN